MHRKIWNHHNLSNLKALSLIIRLALSRNNLKKMIALKLYKIFRLVINKFSVQMMMIIIIKINNPVNKMLNFNSNKKKLIKSRMKK